MQQKFDRRAFLKLTGVGGVVFASGLANQNGWALTPAEDFYFVQLSDIHWGFEGAALNPDARGTLPKAVAAVNALPVQPDFIVFTGDLTHTTDDPVERRKRMTEFRDHVAQLKVKPVYFMPGEHDASLDKGQAFQEFFGKTHYAFDHKGWHFVVIDNVSDPTSSIGEEQLAWLASHLDSIDSKTPLVVFTHRPLFDLAPQWDWATRDGAKALAMFEKFEHVTVFYGHIHQEHHHMTGKIAHHASKSLIFALPAPGSAPKRVGLPWDPAEPYKGLGFREIELMAKTDTAEITEFPVKGA